MPADLSFNTHSQERRCSDVTILASPVQIPLWIGLYKPRSPVAVNVTLKVFNVLRKKNHQFLVIFKNRQKWLLFRNDNS
jgi:hypothetical protein